MLQRNSTVPETDSIARGAARPALAWASLLGVLLALALTAPQARAYSRAWTQATANAPRTGAHDCGAIAFGEALFALDYNDIHASQCQLLKSTDGVRWSTIPYWLPNPQGFQRLAVYKGKMWLIGNSSYYSTDGQNWTLAGESNIYMSSDARLTVFNNKLWLWLQNKDIFSFGLWNSTDGVTWTLVNKTAPCLAHSLGAMVSFAGKLWLMGGTGPQGDLNDVWSSADGKNWQSVTSAAPWSPRRAMSVTAFGGKLWLTGGSTGTQTVQAAPNDVWSSTDGKTWMQVNNPAPWPAKIAPSTVVFKNRLYVMGGYSMPPNQWDINNAILLRDSWSLGLLAPGLPVLGTIGAQQIQEAAPYTGPNPPLIRGSEPIAWTLVKAPAGMKIDSRTGVVQWPRPIVAGSPHAVTLRATNGTGFATATFLLTVNPLRPRLSVPAWPPSVHRIAWTAIPGITGYTIQRAGGPDFASPLQTVTVTTKTREYFFTGVVPDGKTLWYRVRGNRIDGIANAWSNTVSVTQDSRPPAGTVKINNGATSVTSRRVTLNFQVTDAGSGVASFRLSRDGVHWGEPWEWLSFVKTFEYVFDAAKAPATFRIYVQFQDRAGNISAPLSASTTLNTLPICVDAANNREAYGTPERPFKRIADALTGAVPGKSIYVRTGIYCENVEMVSGVKLLGGFPKNSFALARRSPGNNPTTVTTNKPYDALTWDPFHVTMNRITTATLDGFRIDGKNNRSLNNSWGVLCQNVGPSCRVANCLITGYNADTLYVVDTVPRTGAGIICHSASPIISNCVIEENKGNLGGGIFLNERSSPRIENCVIRNNSVKGVYVVKMGQSIYYGGGDGGGIYCKSGSAPVIRNCLIYNNGGTEHPAGITGVASGGLIQNCTIVNNGVGLRNCLGQIRNCIAWGNAKSQLTGSATPSYSLIQRWTGGGTGNISSDPQFVNTTAGNFRLKPASPAIDAGGMIAGLYTDLDGNPRGITGYAGKRGDGSHFDIGAYEYWLPAPAIAPATGVYASPLKVTMTGPAGATIRYTLNGSDPTATSPAYTGPITIKGTPGKTVTVTARAFKTGLTHSTTGIRIYTLR